MNTASKQRSQTQNQIISLEDDSDSSSDLDWLGNLLDPWKVQPLWISQKDRIIPQQQILEDKRQGSGKLQKIENQKKISLRMQNLMKAQQNTPIQLEDSQLIIEDNQLNSPSHASPNLENNNQICIDFSEEEKQVTERNKQVQNEQVMFPNPKRIISSGPQRIMTPKQKQLTKQFSAIIRIINERQTGNEKEYKWEIGTQRCWKTLAQAIDSNFYSFIRHSKKYKSKFLKYLPQNIRLKKQGSHKFQGKISEQIKHSSVKIQKKKEKRIKSSNREMANAKKVFDKVQVSKVMSFEHIVTEKGKDQALNEFDDAIYTQYEPDSQQIEGIIQELVINTNETIKNRRKQRNEPINQSKEVKAMNELLIYKLNQATEGYNYIESMKQLYDFNKRFPTLSCLHPGGLGLRSNNLKIIDKATFQAEMARSDTMKSVIVLTDCQSKNFKTKFEQQKKTPKTKIQ